MVAKQILKLLLPAVLAAGCTSPDSPEPKPENVVFIFATRPEIPKRFYFPGGGYSPSTGPVIRFRSENRTEQIAAIDSLRSDTLVVPLAGGRLLANIRYNFYSSADVLLHNGDTILFTMSPDSLPQIEITNREVPAADLNFDAMRTRRYGRTYGFTMADHYNYRGIIIASMEPNGYKRLKEIGAEVSEKYTRELDDETPWIDSLRAAGVLSDEARDFYAARSAFRKQMHRLYPQTSGVREQTQQQFAPDLYAELAQYDDSLYRNDFYGYYKRLYQALTDKNLGSKNMIRTSNSQYMDSRESFDRLERDTLPLGLLKEEMLVRYFGQIDADFSIDDAKRYYDRLTKQLTDTTLLRIVRTHFGAELGQELQKNDDIALVSIGGDTTSLRKVLADNRGKVAYVDFYASWCVPCMEGMPASEQLRKDYAGKEVVFIYMALNDKPEAWRKAVEKARLQGVAHNYLILEPRLSTMIEQLKVQTIPRLLLFDRQGELAHRNAPRPESPEARREIDKLLAGK